MYRRLRAEDTEDTEKLGEYTCLSLLCTTLVTASGIRCSGGAVSYVLVMLAHRGVHVCNRHRLFEHLYGLNIGDVNIDGFRVPILWSDGER